MALGFKYVGENHEGDGSVFAATYELDEFTGGRNILRVAMITHLDSPHEIVVYAMDSTGRKHRHVGTFDAGSPDGVFAMLNAVGLCTAKLKRMAS